MTSRSPSSDRQDTDDPCGASSAIRPAGTWPGALTVFGMPGAGKTTIAAALAQQGHCVLGEYTADSTAPLPLDQHPDIDDDAAHQANWVRKSAQAAEALSVSGGPVFIDRDWLSALAYAYSIADTDHGTLLRARVAWAAAELRTGNLLLAGTYAVFHLPVADSLRRRYGALRPEHPWSRSQPLYRLRFFYRRPLRIIAHHNRELAAAMGEARWVHQRRANRGYALDMIRDLGRRP